MALLDYFSGYHQIWLRKEDEEKNKSHNAIWHILLHENVRGAAQCQPHILQNDKGNTKGSCWQKRILICQQHCGSVHKKNIVVASKKKASYITNLIETFANLREAKLKLNLEKCVFGVTRGEVLGCLVSTKGIEASPDKTKAIFQMQPPQTRKEVQKLAGCIAALNKFIAKLAERRF
jgi:hypothetical protein